MLSQYSNRILTEAEREKIKENRQKDKQYFDYLGQAVQKMKPRPSTLKHKGVQNQ